MHKVADYSSVGSYFIHTKDSESGLLRGMGQGKIVLLNVADYISVGSYLINAKELKVHYAVEWAQRHQHGGFSLLVTHFDVRIEQPSQISIFPFLSLLQQLVSSMNALYAAS